VLRAVRHVLVLEGVTVGCLAGDILTVSVAAGLKMGGGGRGRTGLTVLAIILCIWDWVLEICAAPNLALEVCVAVSESRLMPPTSPTTLTVRILLTGRA
jgi:hypothetical protein